MEAVWTRFFPLVKQIRDVVGSGKIGEVKRVWADLSFCNDVETTFGVGHRMVNLGLAGGALLDREFFFYFFSFAACFSSFYMGYVVVY